MPRTTYALFTAIRSHLILTSRWGGRRRIYLTGTEYEPTTLSIEQEKVSAALVWMLKGDAAQRVITAWHVGWKPAQEISGSDWLVPFVAHLLVRTG
jgi:hypothetical protein